MRIVYVQAEAAKFQHTWTDCIYLAGDTMRQGIVTIQAVIGPSLSVIFNQLIYLLLELSSALMLLSQFILPVVKIVWTALIGVFGVIWKMVKLSFLSLIRFLGHI